MQNVHTILYPYKHGSSAQPPMYGTDTERTIMLITILQASGCRFVCRSFAQMANTLN